MTSAVHPPTPLHAPKPAPAQRTGRWRAYRLLVYAVLLSLVVHFALTLWPVRPAGEPDEAPLSVSITELPPPPLPVAQPSPAAKAAAARHLRPPSPLAPPRFDAEDAPPEAAAPRSAQTDAPVASPTPAPLEEEVTAAATPPASSKTLPPRVDLVYKLYQGRQGFLIGDATYRFEHADNRYRIYTVGKARGLVALLVHGEGRLESRGLITADGLQPTEFSFERSDTGKREEAEFDWETGVVNLAGNKTATIEPPMFDALSLMWQYYFTPPTSASAAFSLATTRRVTRYEVTREGNENIQWGQGRIDTERWHRVSDDGKSDSYAWLAPSLRFLPVKMRLSNPRGSVEVVLDAIRVDPSAKSEGDGWAPHVEGGAADAFNNTPPPGTAPPPTEFAPGATFPTNTGS